MSVYSDKAKEKWRYDFVLSGVRYSSKWYPKKKEASEAEAEERRTIRGQKRIQTGASEIPEKDMIEEAPIDIAFLEIVNEWLDDIQERRSPRHYDECHYLARRWVKKWGSESARAVTRSKVSKFIERRKIQVSAKTANKELRHMRSMFNYGIKAGLIAENPTKHIDFYSVKKAKVYVPPQEDIERVLDVSEPDTQDYLWTVRETMARISEINQLEWEDVDLAARTVVLYTKKSKGGNEVGRSVAMTGKLKEILEKRFRDRDPMIPWVFAHRYWDREAQCWTVGPFQYRKTLMERLCRVAGVRHFGFHGLRHAGARLMDDNGATLGSIQNILGHQSQRTTEIYLDRLGKSPTQTPT